MPHPATVMPEADECFRLEYEGLHHIAGPWCTIEVYRREGVTLIVATDETDSHQDVSITNRIERVMFLAWERVRHPWPCIFVEQYRDSPMRSHCDRVTFDLKGAEPLLAGCWSAGRIVGSQFVHPQWKPLDFQQPAEVATLLLLAEVN